MNKAEELIACLEGEIAKLDARIVELESDLAGTQSRVLSLQDQWRKLDAELAALKAQDPVAWISWSNEDPEWKLKILAEPVHPPVVPLNLYAAPVSEAKAQGVVMPAPDIKTGHGYPAYSVAAVTELFARLNAAPVQQVSVPDASTDFSKFLSAVMDAAGLVRHGRRSKELSEYLGSKCMEYRCFASPAAPAADAGLVEALEKLARLGNGDKYGNSDGNLIAQAALAAHSANGVV